jgi:citrate lyase subunit beta/citryl-CoA lyase
MVELEPLRRTIERARRLGCFGAIVIHPSHVAVANEMYQPTKAEIRSAEAIVAGLRAARAAGDAATVVAGRMVDIAHARTAATLLREAAEWGHPVDPDLVAEAD